MKRRTVPKSQCARTAFQNRCGLPPQGWDEFEYQVPGRPDLKGSFRRPPPERGQFEFVVYGDTRTRHDVHRKVIAALLEHCHPDFAVQTGDLVNDGGDPSAMAGFSSRLNAICLRQVAY